MNPQHLAKSVPLQVERYGGVPAQPGAPTMVQYTSVSVTTEPPKDHIIWSLCCFVYSNPFCLGLAALIFSIKSRDQKAAGDLEGARQYSSTALHLNIVATIAFSILVIIIIRYSSHY
ncbi:dispanin subfamily A member 2b-like [Anabas testudineus]|uniref:dispanin subfamily A member 2b-like n=1 Tax=Anabas testudineus TaxID=64144 RepID=UPI000E457FC7|nr:dispanin subfamily A member 2b-like [Anabas testudineus]